MLIIPEKLKTKYAGKEWFELQKDIRNADEETQWELALYFTDYYKYLWLKNRSIAYHLCAEDFLMIIVTDTKAILKQYAGREDRYFLFLKNFSFMKRSVHTRVKNEIEKRYATDYIVDDIPGKDYYQDWECREILMSQLVEEDIVVANYYLTALVEFMRNDKSWVKTSRALTLTQAKLKQLFLDISLISKTPLRNFIHSELGVSN